MDNNNSSFFEKMSTTTTPPVATPATSVIPPIPPKNGPNKKLIAGVVAVLLLVFGVGAGAVLVQQNQNINEEAAVPPGCNVSYSGNGTNGPTSFTLSGDCPGQIITFEGNSCPTTSTRVSTSGAGSGTFTASPPSGKCQQVDYDPSTDPGQGIGVCTCAGGSGGGGDDNNNDSNGTTAKQCGQACSSDDQCKASNSNSVCRNGMCENSSCAPGKTQPGKNCACSTLNSCGSPCGIGSGLCQAGSQCGFVNIAANRCEEEETLAGDPQNPNQVCIPLSPAGGYKLAPQCSDLQAIRLAKPDGSETSITRDNLIAACAGLIPDTSPSPSSSPTSSTPPGTLVCNQEIREKDTAFVQFETAEVANTTQAFIPPRANESGIQVFGVDVRFNDDDDDFEYKAIVTFKDGTTSETSMTHPCPRRSNGWIDVCTPGGQEDFPDDLHTLILSNYLADPNKSIANIKFQLRPFASVNNGVTFFEVYWKYRKVCPAATPTTISMSCSAVKIYNTSWTEISASDLTKLKAGDKVMLAVNGTTSSGTINKARFTVNNLQALESTTKRTGTNDFYVEYTIPNDIKTFTVKGELQHSNNTWF